MSTKQKRCRYCKCLFIPDPRVKNQQVACGKISCCKARKRETQKRWLEENPGYFKGRYPNTKEWLKQHPGYLKRYRQAHPEYVENNKIKQKQRRERQKGVGQVRGTGVAAFPTDKKSVDIQDTIISKSVEKSQNMSRLACVDIQDTISTQLVMPVYLRDILPSVDIQDNIDRIVFRKYTWARMVREEQLRKFILDLIGARRKWY